MRSIAPTSVLLAGLILGCNSQSSAPTSSPTVPGKGASARRAPADPSAKQALRTLVLLTVQVGKLRDNGDETTEISRELQDPDATVIREQVNALDWANPKLRPNAALRFVGTARANAVTNAAKGVLSINGGLNTPHPDGPFRATWQGLGEAFRSEPLKSLDAGIDLLVSFRNGDDKWQSLTKWTQFE